MIKSFIIAAVSADGLLAKNPKHASYWTSQEDKKRFVQLTSQAGAIIMGSTTYDTMNHPFAGKRVIVYSRSPKHFEGAETTSLPPKELLHKLEQEGVKEVAVCGGSYIYTMFMKAQAVDKIYLTVEPLLFGKGIPLFNEELQNHLHLLSAEKADSGSILLEYDVNYHGGKLIE